MNIMKFVQCPARGSCPGPDLGYHGHRRIYHLPRPGYCRSDRGRNPVYRRRSLHYDDARADRTYGLPCLCALLAGMAAGLVTGLFHTVMGIPAILAGILTQLGLYSVNLKIMGKGEPGH